MNKDKVGYLLLDMETGGLAPLHNRHDPLIKGNPILSVGVILLDEDLQLVDWHYSLVKPAYKDSQGEPLRTNDIALQINGLDIKDCVANGQTEADMLFTLEQICTLMDDIPLVLTGSNPSFDRGFWDEAARREGDKVSKLVRRRVLDTYELNVRHLMATGHTPRHSLDNSSLAKFMKYLNVEHDAHNALGDCKAVWRCLALHFDKDIEASYNRLTEQQKDIA